MLVEFELDGRPHKHTISAGTTACELLAELGRKPGYLLRNGLLCRSHLLLAGQLRNARLVTLEGLEASGQLQVIEDSLRDCGLEVSPQALLSAWQLLNDESWRDTSVVAAAFDGVCSPAPVDALQLAGQRRLAQASLTCR